MSKPGWLLDSGWRAKGVLLANPQTALNGNPQARQDSDANRENLVEPSSKKNF